MKEQKIQELKNKSIEELQKLLGENYEKLRKLRFNLASNKLKNVREISETKKTIARILTFIHYEK
ncbi:50S ribosomal protein L29 [Candidatus Wolfebacteria bacterium CG03_land_8_20_14_0_80_36_15]|uniref:Large ribosomal subunit protein uL29 n=1 Tax=Candidatus Wolfebacteria bacterium CG03_land_8_20_14_0_80_36_15 TaxID=1975067 RepID=A0A2M7B7L6_9BACT|nr:MAG: 50S ribosomal protein L29 [Candidatus Wolfebacteria bacterium CG03_land_8_20_14_0_80_36_15]